MGSDALRTMLEISGYEIRFREHDWIECLITGGGEAWVGQGADRDAAFQAALRQACPTSLSRRLLAEVLRLGVDSLAKPGDWPPWGSKPETLANKTALPSVMVRAGTPLPSPPPSETVKNSPENPEPP